MIKMNVEFKMRTSFFHVVLFFISDISFKVYFSYIWLFHVQK